MKTQCIKTRNTSNFSYLENSCYETLKVFLDRKGSAAESLRLVYCALELRDRRRKRAQEAGLLKIIGFTLLFSLFLFGNFSFSSHFSNNLESTLPRDVQTNVLDSRTPSSGGGRLRPGV